MNWYETGFGITFFIAFIIGWIYAMSQYGLFLGLALGWIPALMIGFMAGAIWPLIALVIGGFLLAAVFA